MSFIKRTSIILAALALVGAAINFPLAMAFDRSRTAQAAVPQVASWQGADAAARGWPARTPHATPWPAPNMYHEFGAFGYRRAHVGLAGAGTANHAMQVTWVGWPLPCVRVVQAWWPWNDPKWTSNAEPDPKPMIHWPGAIGNPAILAATGWLVFAMPLELFVFLRQRRRRKQRRCLKCGYPLAPSGLCTECGTTHAAQPLPA